MTRFWREGHSRTNRVGGTYWVEGHWVERLDWRRHPYASPSWPPPGSGVPAPVSAVGAATGRSARSMTPNSECPICHAPVFFYSNDSGSRVYFDALGPPWPKHPCIPETPRYPSLHTFARSADRNADRSTPWQNPSRPGEGALDESGAGTGEGWEPCFILWRRDRLGRAHYLVSARWGPPPRIRRFSTPLRDDLPTKGDILHLRGERISYFSFTQFMPCEVAVIRTDRAETAMIGQEAAPPGAPPTGDTDSVGVAAAALESALARQPDSDVIRDIRCDLDTIRAQLAKSYPSPLILWLARRSMQHLCDDTAGAGPGAEVADAVRALTSAIP